MITPWVDPGCRHGPRAAGRDAVGFSGSSAASSGTGSSTGFEGLGSGCTLILSVNGSATPGNRMEPKSTSFPRSSAVRYGLPYVSLSPCQGSAPCSSDTIPLDAFGPFPYLSPRIDGPSTSDTPKCSYPPLDFLSYPLSSFFW